MEDYCKCGECSIWDCDCDNEDSYCEWCGEDDFNCQCGLDYCCFDPRYTGDRNYCACAEHAKEEWRKTKWYWKVYHLINEKFRSIKFYIKEYNHKRKCDSCGKESLTRKWKDINCPKCGEEDLPF